MSLEFDYQKLGSISDVKGGKRLPKGHSLINIPNSHPYIKVKDMAPDKLLKLTDNFEYIENETFNEISQYIVNKGDLIISIVGTIGLTNIIEYSLDNANLTENCAKITNLKKGYNVDYIYYFLNSKIGQNLIQESTVGAVQKKLPIKNIRDLNIPFPNFDIQNKIVDLLSTIDKKIENCKSINKNLEEQLSLIFDDYFVKCSAYDEDSLVKTDWGKIPKEWKNIDFGDLIQITSGDRPDEKSETKTDDFNIPLFGASKIMGYTKEFSYDEDILIIGRVGTHGVVQRVNYPCFPSDNTFVIKSKYYGFVYQLLKRIDYDSLNTGSTQPLITQKSLKTVNVVLPDENSLFEFENISKVFFDKIYINQKEIGSLTKLRDTLLPKLMSGEIDVSKINCDFKIFIRNFILNPLNYSILP